jgi:hypothetical protein
MRERAESACLGNIAPHQSLLEAEYWDSPGNVVSSLKVAFALLTGTQGDYGDHQKVSF